MGELDIAERRTAAGRPRRHPCGRAPMDLRMAVLPTTYGEKVILRILQGGGSKAHSACPSSG